MGKQWWSPKPNVKAKVIDLTNHHLLSLVQKELKKEKKKVKRLKYVRATLPTTLPVS